MGVPKKLMTADELAEFLDIPRATLSEWRYKGKGPRAIKVGRHLRYDLRDVEAWLEEKKAVAAG